MKQIKTSLLAFAILLFTTACSSNDDSNEIDTETPVQEEEVILATEAPFYPINFEEIGFGADWSWSVFENGNNPAVEFVANPSKSGINSSATVAKFTALQEGAAWVGCETQHGSDIGTFKFDATNSIVKIMV